mgnify:FL=1
MIYQAILKIRGKEIPILYYSYRCHIQHCDDPNLRRIIQLHIEACEKTGNREYLPVEGDLIKLMFECSGDEQFFYDWLNVEGTMEFGEIHFIYNENEVVDIFRFYNCFCVKIEESMSAVNSPMVMTIYLSPGIIKRNNLEVREKIGKLSDYKSVSNIEEKNITNKIESLNNNSKDENTAFTDKSYKNIIESSVISKELIDLAHAACERAKTLKQSIKNIVPKIRNSGKKTVASDSIQAISGWTIVDGYTTISPEEVSEYCSSIGHIPTPTGAADQVHRGGFAGKYNCSHSEKKILTQIPNEIIGVSKKMCGDCIEFCTKQAQHTQKVVIVADPNKIYVFLPNGEHTEIDNK